MMWNKITDPDTKKKVESKRLTNRRTDEVELHIVGDYKKKPAMRYIFATNNLEV